MPTYQCTIYTENLFNLRLKKLISLTSLSRIYQKNKYVLCFVKNSFLITMRTKSRRIYDVAFFVLNILTP